MIVQISSIVWPSNNLILVILFVIMVIKIYEIKAVIIDKISIVWSWKKISCSIIGEEAFWKVKLLHIAIFKEVSLLIDFKSIAICSATLKVIDYREFSICVIFWGEGVDSLDRRALVRWK